MIYLNSMTFSMKAILFLQCLFGILCHHFITCYVCHNIYFETDNFQMCHERCAECSLLYSCLQCKNTLSGSSCVSICRENCDIILIANGTKLLHCYNYRDKIAKLCCISCPPYSICSECAHVSGGHCMKCKNNSYGNLTDCDQRCGHCYPNKNKEVLCDIDTGRCQNDCLAGYHGQRCDMECNRNCFDSQTNSTKCARDTGKCIFGCVPGRYKETCQSICSSNCLEEFCDQTSGTCKECLPGWYGDRCERKCSEMCASQECDKRTGSCLKGCIQGRYGNKCEVICSQRCLNNTCHQRSGYCENGCSPGSFGNYCNKECNSICLKKICDRNKGQCLLGCAIGWFGSLCNKACSKTCVDASCDQVTGICDKGCIAGYHGENCTKNCSENSNTFENATVPCISCVATDNGRNKTYQSESTEQISMENIVIYGLVGLTVILLCFVLMYFIHQYFIRRRKHKYEQEIVMSKMNINEESIYNEIEDISDIVSGETSTAGYDTISSHLSGGHKTNKRIVEQLEENTTITPFDETVYCEAYEDTSRIILGHKKQSPSTSSLGENDRPKTQRIFNLTCMSDNKADANYIEDSSKPTLIRHSYSIHNQIDHLCALPLNTASDQREETTTNCTNECWTTCFTFMQ